MSDFEDDLESIEEEIDRETDYHDNDTDHLDWSDSVDDLESDEWSRQFGDSYVEDHYDVDDLDDDELERLEEEFFDAAEDDEELIYDELEGLDDLDDSDLMEDEDDIFDERDSE